MMRRFWDAAVGNASGGQIIHPMQVVVSESGSAIFVKSAKYASRCAAR
jgi:hypothetical protein